MSFAIWEALNIAPTAANCMAAIISPTPLPIAPKFSMPSNTGSVIESVLFQSSGIVAAISPPCRRRLMSAHLQETFSNTVLLHFLTRLPLTAPYQSGQR